jgi:outer membrane biosynthesis protein TonB
MKEALNQEENRTKAALGSFIVHSALLAFLIFYTFPKTEIEETAEVIQIEWGGGGDNAAAGLPDEGQGDDPAPQGQQMEDPSVTEPVDDPAPTPTPPSTPPPPAKTPPASSPAPSNSPTTNDPEVAALKKQQEADRQRQAEADRQRRAQEEAQRAAETERQRQAQAEADRKRREQEERDRKKGQFGGSFGKPGSTGTGQGNTGKPGNQGIPGGTGDNPFGKSNGTGGGTGGGDGTGTGASVGGGLGGRKVVTRGRVNDDSQKKGRVVIEVCVDGDGRVVSADYTQRGSTTSDSELRNKALAAARGYRFAASGSDKECGTITFNFQLK